MYVLNNALPNPTGVSLNFFSQSPAGRVNQNLIDVKFASGIKNINFGFYPYTDVC